MKIKKYENKREYDNFGFGMPLDTCNEHGCEEFAAYEITIGMFTVRLCEKCAAKLWETLEIEVNS